MLIVQLVRAGDTSRGVMDADVSRSSLVLSNWVYLVRILILEPSDRS